MKSIISVLVFSLIAHVAFPQQKRGVSSPAFDLSEQTKIISSKTKGIQVGTKTYELELFSGSGI